jgi:hypothetical protein
MRQVRVARRYYKPKTSTSYGLISGLVTGDIARLRANRGIIVAALSSRGPGRGPLKAQTRVRIPLALFCHGRTVAAPSSIG